MSWSAHMAITAGASRHDLLALIGRLRPVGNNDAPAERDEQLEAAKTALVAMLLAARNPFASEDPYRDSDLYIRIEGHAHPHDGGRRGALEHIHIFIERCPAEPLMEGPVWHFEEPAPYTIHTSLNVRPAGNGGTRPLTTHAEEAAPGSASPADTGPSPGETTPAPAETWSADATFAPAPPLPIAVAGHNFPPGPQA